MPWLPTCFANNLLRVYLSGATLLYPTIVTLLFTVGIRKGMIVILAFGISPHKNLIPGWMKPSGRISMEYQIIKLAFLRSPRRQAHPWLYIDCYYSTDILH